MHLPRIEQVELTRQAREAEALELQWIRRSRVLYRKITAQVVAQVESGSSQLDVDPRLFEQFLVLQLYLVQKKAITGASHLARLARVPKGPSPARTIDDLVAQWTEWRRGRNIPKRQKTIAKRMHYRYMDRIRSAWKHYSEPFRRGEVFNQEEVVRQIERVANASAGEARTIVATETTRHYNIARRDFYDSSPDVTHYLFLCIRDHRTTQWCRTRAGVVYRKGTTVLDRETPPIHWNCRSEIAPLTPHNPVHFRLIEDSSIQRANRSPTPLPPGWNK